MSNDDAQKANTELHELKNSLPIDYKGVAIGSVQSGSPAYKEVYIGHIIIAIDGHAVVRIDDIMSYIELHKPVGDNVKLTVNRNGQIMDFNQYHSISKTSSIASR